MSFMPNQGHPTLHQIHKLWLKPDCQVSRIRHCTSEVLLSLTNALCSRVPMKRLGSTEEVIKTVAFLLSDDSSYTTGTNLVVDGGMIAGLKC